MDIRIPFLNAFKLRITGNITSGTHTETADMNVVRNLIVNFVRRGRIFQAHGIDMQGRIVILNLGTLPSGTYGVELVGYYNGEPWRYFKKDVFEIVRQNSDATPAGSGDVPTYDVTFELNFGGESVSPEYVDAAIAAHDADEQAHADIREALQTLEAELRQEIAEAGEVNDVQIDGQSILDPETKVANIDSSQFGKVDDVKVNGVSALDPTTKKVSLTIPTSASAEAQDNTPGTPSATAEMDGTDIHITFRNLKGEKGDPLTWDDLDDLQKASLKGEQGDSAIWDENEPHDKLTDLANVLGDSTVKPMSQQGVTNAIIASLSPDFKTKDVTEVQSLKINTESNPAVTETQSSAAWRLYYAQIEAGRTFRITFKNSTYTSRKVTIAIFRSMPNTEGVEAAEVLIDEERNLSEGVTYTFIPRIGGYVAFGNYAQTTQVTMEEALSVGERFSDVDEKIEEQAEETNGRIDEVAQKLDGDRITLVEGVDYDVTIGTFINKSGGISLFRGGRYSSPIAVHESDVIIYTCHGGAANGSCATLSKVIEDGSRYEVLVPHDDKEYAERTYSVGQEMEVAFSWINQPNYGELEACIIRGGLEKEVEAISLTVQRHEEQIPLYDPKDGKQILGENPLARLISGPSRARIFASYGIIGASFECGAENPGTGTPQIYDNGYEWPTIFAKVNGVEVYNHALAGESLNRWKMQRGNPAVQHFPGHCVPWSDYDESPAECYIINMSSNDLTRGKYGGAPGDVEQINLEHDYSEDSYDIYTPFTEVITGIIQLCRNRSPKCFIMLATVRKISLSDYTLYRTPEETEDLCNAMKAVAELFDNCFVIDMHEYGLDWPSVGRSLGYQSVGVHPTRLGHIYLADVFNTYIDWIVDKNRAAFKDVSLILR